MHDGRQKETTAINEILVLGRRAAQARRGRQCDACVRMIMREMPARQRVAFLLSLNSYHHALAAAEGKPLPLNLTFSQWVNADEDRKITMKCELTRSIAYAAWLAAGGRPE